MSDFTDIFDAVENTPLPKNDSVKKSKKQNKNKKEKKRKESKHKETIDNSQNFEELFGDSACEPQKDCESKPTEKPKRKLFRRKSEENLQEESPETTSTKPNNSWRLLSETDLTENEVPEEVADIVDNHERVIGKRLKTELDINEARGLDLSLRDRIELTRKYLNKEADELKRLEEYRREEEVRTNHVVTLRNFVLTELGIHLETTNQELVMSIDAKFGPYIEEAMREVELGYFVREIPRNADLVNLNPNLPYKYGFMIRAI